MSNIQDRKLFECSKRINTFKDALKVACVIVIPLAPMEPTGLPLVIKSPNDKVPTQNIQCDRVWSVKDLKEHLGESYPTQPDPSSLRLIHAGKLLKDDTPLATLFKDFSQPQTVHLVCRNQKVPEKSEDTSATSEDVTNDIPTDELEKYQRAYYEYLQQFYMNNSDIVQTNVNGAHAWPYANAHFTGMYPLMMLCYRVCIFLFDITSFYSGAVRINPIVEARYLIRDNCQ
ncbi:hypothetical protein PHET_10050 [Paragonimus heterotremus]|uniref:Ubiquitin-like domain-containing protein n=1 Tax=Paragonimus heterotremus TaxID=100268 RepID=A0A8J4T2E2_9TREM|nr:hypothetical protein PHET_10050 [Paragonimus heterotremus]